MVVIVISMIFKNQGRFFSETGQNLPHYAMMCLVYTTWMSCRCVGNGLISVIKARGWRYLLLALIDVEACTLITSSHQFTSLASIQVYQSLTLIMLKISTVQDNGSPFPHGYLFDRRIDIDALVIRLMKKKKKNIDYSY